MRRLVIEALVRNIPTDRKMHPFPGKYPTRVAWRVYEIGSGKYEQYIGKPSIPAVARFYKLLASRNCWYYAACEFDKRGIMLANFWGSGIWNVQQEREYPRWRTVDNQFSLYHPGDTAHNVFGSFVTKFVPTKIGKGYWCYLYPGVSPMDVVKDSLIAAAVAYGYIDAKRAATTERQVPESPRNLRSYSTRVQRWRGL